MNNYIKVLYYINARDKIDGVLWTGRLEKIIRNLNNNKVVHVKIRGEIILYPLGYIKEFRLPNGKIIKIS